MRHVPRTMGTYFEPFLGGGALFFALAAAARSAGARNGFRHAVLTDVNAELIQCYQTIRADVAAVIAALAVHMDGELHFYRIRDQDPASLSPPERAARTIYLNKNGYNGLYRVNRSGRFNVPFGKYATVRSVSAERLRAVAHALEDVTLKVCDFEECVAAAAPDDFVYFDPPYVPVSPTSTFTAYSEGGFASEQQARLSNVLKALGAARVRALLSNSDCPATRALYRGLPMTRVQVARPINSIAARRGHVAELMVRSFRYSC